ncbi:MAG: vanadium-dependent haloperoxidase [Chitinophagaceae bacterium]|nr:vanadium-dependent haloperoxidase [Chitinophagaceae bacterium]
MIAIRKIVLAAFMLTAMTGSHAQPETALLHRAQDAITTVIVHDIFSPPVASRIYLYSSLAGYEATTAGTGKTASFKSIRPDFPAPDPAIYRKQIDVPYSSLYAMLLTASRFVFSDTAMLDSLQTILKSYPALPAGVKKASEAWAHTVSDSVMSWSRTDNYAATRKLRRYSHLKDPAAWIPTPPGYMAAVEPHWGKMRPVIIGSLAEYRPATPMPFGKDSGSAFFKQAMEVYQASKKMSPGDSAIALFWDCNPFHLTTQGHLNLATKKLSPGGHWMSIAGVCSRKAAYGFNRTVSTYLLTAIALYDGFISCWDEKYRSNTIRPETFINAYIDENWRPLLQTPPFPEYTSGHSVISAAAAEVLTAVFGDSFAFDDDTETAYGLPIRSFASFRQAASEAAVSRFYGGIHYREAIENGSVQGKKIGLAVAAQAVNGLLPPKTP